MHINENVYVVYGEKRAAIYDLNRRLLYHLNDDAAQLLSGIELRSTFTSSEKKFVSELEALGVLTREEIPTHDITDLSVEPKIDFAWIELTTRCNLQCVHCHDDSGPANVCTMNLTDFKHIIDELVDFGVQRIQLIGGEPFTLGDDLKIYIDYCIGKFKYIEIFTNGTLIKDHWFHYLSSNGIHISLSVYSYNDLEHNRITKSETSFELTNHTIEKLEEYGIVYRVKNVLMSGLNLGERNTDLYELSNKRDIVRLVGRANRGLLDEKLLRAKLITPATFARKLNPSLIRRLVSGHNCFSRRLYFSANLQVYPCVMERRVSHGSIKNHSLKSLIKAEIRNFGKDKINGCCDCEFRYCCFDCRPDSDGRDIAAKPWFCMYDPRTGQWEDEDAFVAHFWDSSANAIRVIEANPDAR